MPSGNGFAAGYGNVARSDYATPACLAPVPWTPDFTVSGGFPAYPSDRWINPYNGQQPLLWQTDDWDPGLRIWSLPFDPRLTEWLQDTDLAAPSTLAAREFASQYQLWTHEATDLERQIASLLGDEWLLPGDVRWWPKSDHISARTAAWHEVACELDNLQNQMQDSRAMYRGEALAQSEGITNYFIHLMAIDVSMKPWTVELMRCALAIGNVVYMYFKSAFRRVRPSRLCAGLVPPFGPPQHPAFPSGHSFLGHFIALLLMEIEPVAQRFGLGMGGEGRLGRKPTRIEMLVEPWNADGALLWLALRLAQNRERMGLHYPSDGTASRHLATGVWNAIFNDGNLQAPTLQRILKRARAEW